MKRTVHLSLIVAGSLAVLGCRNNTADDLPPEPTEDEVLQTPYGAEKGHVQARRATVGRDAPDTPGLAVPNAEVTEVGRDGEKNEPELLEADLHKRYDRLEHDWDQLGEDAHDEQLTARIEKLFDRAEEALDTLGDVDDEDEDAWNDAFVKAKQLILDLEEAIESVKTDFDDGES